jgi:hypothetical protein
MPTRIAQRGEEPTERADATQHISVGTDAAAGDARSGHIDLVDLLGKAMTDQSQRAAPERIGELKITACSNVRGLDGPNPLRLSGVPLSSAAANRQSGLEELGAHSPIAQQQALLDGFMERNAHRCASVTQPEAVIPPIPIEDQNRSMTR